MTAKYFNIIEFQIIQRLFRYGLSMNQAEQTVYPLSWYISTGRCPIDTLKKIVNASNRQITTIAKRLMISGSHDDILSSALEYINKIA